MEPDPAPDRAALLAYATDTGGAVAQLALWMLGEEGEDAQSAAAAVGRAWALTGLMRAVPFHASQDRVYPPADELDEDAAHALRHGRAEPQVRGVLAELAGEARAALAEARRLHGRPRREALAALLPAVQAEGYLRRLERAGHDPFAPVMALPRRRPVVLLLNVLARRY